MKGSGGGKGEREKGGRERKGEMRQRKKVGTACLLKGAFVAVYRDRVLLAMPKGDKLW